MKKPKPCISYTVIKHSGHLGTIEKCRKHLPAARVLYTVSLVFSNARRVLSQCNTRRRLLYKSVKHLSNTGYSGSWCSLGTLLVKKSS